MRHNTHHDDNTIDFLPTGPRRFRCRHVHPNGNRCGSPSLRDEPFCYFHHTSRGQAANRLARTVRGLNPTLPDPTDLTERSGIQLAIAEVLHLIAVGDIDPRRAGLLLYGLQIASANLSRPNPQAAPSLPVEQVTFDPELGPLALPAEFETTSPQTKGPAQLLLEELKRDFPDLDCLNASAAPTRRNSRTRVT